MFWKRKTKPSLDAASHHDVSPLVTAMRSALNEKTDNTIKTRANLARRDITQTCIALLKDDRGVRLETALGVLGSLAGFSAAYSMMRHIQSGQLKAEMPEVMILTVKTVEKYMFGDYINRKLIEGEKIDGQMLSLWALAGGMAEHLGHAPRLSHEALFQRVAKSVGTEGFGLLDLPEQHHPGDTPQNFSAYLFEKFIPCLERYEVAVEYYWLAFALSAQELIEMGKTTLNPEIAAKIVMECAVPASKIDPSNLIPVPLPERSQA